jgi:UDP-N-acetylglucosamine--N-acetylmuramyl-(pentapeptide) pyrophosphoryl-undecaprenol N-acetylglucosamine transferase
VRATFVLAAGGTGGHLFPAEAVARLLVASGGTVHLLTDRRADNFAAAVPGVTIDLVRAGQLGGGPFHAAYGLAELALGMMQARRLLRRLAPAAVVGFGGYPSVPTMLAAAQLGLPALIHEQNAVFGRANRMLAPRAHRIATGFAETQGLRAADRGRTVHTGNPVRPPIQAVGTTPYAPLGETIELLVTGGSQGAHVFSEIVPPALAMLPAELRQRLHVAQQARPEDKDAVVAQYRELGIAADVDSFFTDMPERLRRAHLVICRAGASTSWPPPVGRRSSSPTRTRWTPTRPPTRRNSPPPARAGPLRNPSSPPPPLPTGSAICSPTRKPWWMRQRPHAPSPATTRPSISPGWCRA